MDCQQLAQAVDRTGVQSSRRNQPQILWVMRANRDAAPAQPPYPVVLIGGGRPQDWTWRAHIYCGEDLFGMTTKSDQVDLRHF